MQLLQHIDPLNYSISYAFLGNFSQKMERRFFMMVMIFADK